MTHEPRSDKRPVEAVARAIAEDLEAAFPARLRQSWDDLTPQARGTMRCRAAAAINRLRELGFITADGLAAIHAEEDANGQPRSVLPRYAPPRETNGR